MYKVLALAFTLLWPLGQAAWAADLMAFWESPQRGGNSFNRLPPTQAYFDALAATGATWVRLSYHKWPAEERDFLIGDADGYDGLVTGDLEVLTGALDRAHRAGLKVVVAPLSLPLMRWAQNNDGRFDDRLWSDFRNWREPAGFWRELAEALRDHPAVAAYNLINEPAPERMGGLAEHAPLDVAYAWYSTHRGRGRDLAAFYAQVVKAIREVDPHTPVMLDAGWYAAADGFNYWPAALPDPRVLYSVHMYEPWQVTSDPSMFKRPLLAYPGVAPFAGGQARWDGARVGAYLGQFVSWAQRMGIPRQQLVLGEFGCLRKWPGCGRYLEDVVAIAERLGLHWAFYAFREDAWDGMDYELGTGPVPWAYWKAVDAGAPDPVIRPGSPLFDIIQQRLDLGR